MKNRNKIGIVLFVIFFVFLIIVRLMRYQTSEAMAIIMIALVFNVCLIILGMMITNKLLNVRGARIFLVIFYLILACGAVGTLAEYDGDAWSVQQASDHDLYGTSTANGLALAVGAKGTVLQRWEDR